VTFGGYPATRFEFSVPAAFDLAACSDLIRLWPDPGPDENGGEPIFPGQTTTIWVIDDDGRVTAAVAVRHVDSPPADVIELQGIVDSVQFWR
jgi:hypothetical protein